MTFFSRYIFQAFREVFEYLIDDFKTYRPLLSAIKSEYENLIEFQKEKIRELEPLQVKLILMLQFSLCSLWNQFETITFIKKHQMILKSTGRIL